MNYIRHLNTFFSFVKTDKRLAASHVSLYLALFHYWNFNRFQNPFSIYRENIMQLSKLSKNTYHKCLKELHQAKYIYYHPSPSKFQAVRISVIRLDIEDGIQSQDKQPNLFDGREIETDSVANLSHNSPNIKTDTVPNLGHIYKPNIDKQRETPTHEIFKKNDKIQNAINDFAGVANSGQDKQERLSFRAEREISNTSIPVPAQQEVEKYFYEKNYPKDEAIKFFNHYKALEWKLQGRTPILRWQPLVKKWMQNAKKWDTPYGGVPRQRDGSFIEQERDLQYLYDLFIEGKNILQHLIPEHFAHLKLSLSEEILQQALTQRIHQVSGTNQYSLNQLWQAYLTNDPEHELVKKDKPSLIAIAKRLAVLNYFNSLRQSGTKSLPP